MHATWGQDLDANQDGKLAWQTGAESLGPKVGQCVVVAYEKQPAKKEKDPKKPGTWIDTPEQWVPRNWLTCGELLSTTTVQGAECEVIGVVEETRCSGKDGKVLPGPSASDKLLQDAVSKGQKCPGPWGFPTSCPKDPAAERKACEAKGGSLVTLSTMQGCEKWPTFGPDTLEAFLSVAERNFDSEDHDGDGVIRAGEGQTLCLR